MVAMAPGANGSDGQNGLTSLTVQTELAVGDANCPNSGIRIDSGLDADADGTLGDSESLLPAMFVFWCKQRKQ